MVEQSLRAVMEDLRPRRTLVSIEVQFWMVARKNS